jgi:DNA-binding MarR family transcriptional regulator
MDKRERVEAALILDRFIEGIFRVMQDHHRSHVLEMDLTLVQVQALAFLHDAPFLATRLAESLGVSAPSMSQLTDRLIRKHLIERQSVDGDRRAVMIALTVEGNRVVNRFRKRRSEVFAQILSRLDESDRMEVIDALAKVVAALEEPLDGKPSRQMRKAMAERRPVQGRESPSRTAVKPSEASKESGEPTVRLPARLPVRPVRKMRIEWD